MLAVLVRGRRLPVLAVVEGRRQRRLVVLVLMWNGRRRREVEGRWALVSVGTCRGRNGGPRGGAGDGGPPA